MKPVYSFVMLLLIPCAVVAMEQNPNNNNNNTASPSRVQCVERTASRSDSQIPGSNGFVSLSSSPRSASLSAVARTSSSDLFFRNFDNRLESVLKLLPNTTDDLCKKLKAIAADEKSLSPDRVALIKSLMQQEEKPVLEWMQKVIDTCNDSYLSKLIVRRVSSSNFSEELPPAHEIAGSPRSRSGSIVVRSRGSSNADQQGDQK